MLGGVGFERAVVSEKQHDRRLARYAETIQAAMLRLLQQRRGHLHARICYRALVVWGLLFVGACTDTSLMFSRTDPGVLGSGYRLAATPMQKEAVAGMEALAAGDGERASRHFNRALQAEPDSSPLHMLNGLAYHLAFARGVRARMEMAETGYLLALQFDPTNDRAAYFLGLLYLESRRFQAAQAQLLRAVRMSGSEESERLYALAVASYFAQDVEIALWAIERALALSPERPELLEAAALVNAAAGRSSQAETFATRYAVLDPQLSRMAAIRRRLADWVRVHGQLAQAPAGPPQTPGNQPHLPPGFGSPPGPSPFLPPGAAELGTGGENRRPVAQSWSDCIQTLTQSSGSGSGPGYGGSSSYGGASGTGSADETTPLPALPAPCRGLPLPRMAMVDIVLIRTEEQRNTAQGVNVLDGLQIVLTGSRSRTIQTGTTSSNTRTTSVGIALPSAGIIYSLNIANAADARTEVMARPTLVALDRIPSNFFSGSNVSVALSGQYGGSISQQPVGVSLSVTPTFIDDDTMLISVKATRSFFETATRGSFSQSLNTTRNTVTANIMLKFGQTLILSGMRERDLQDSDAGVPLLREIPGIRYLFGRRTTQDFEKEVLILLTPRRPTFLNEGLASAREYRSRSDLDPRGRHDADRARAEARRSDLGLTPNVTAILSALADNEFYTEFRTGDLAPPRLHRSVDLEQLIRDVREMLMF